MSNYDKTNADLLRLKQSYLRSRSLTTPALLNGLARPQDTQINRNENNYDTQPISLFTSNLTPIQTYQPIQPLTSLMNTKPDFYLGDDGNNEQMNSNNPYQPLQSISQNHNNDGTSSPNNSQGVKLGRYSLHNNSQSLNQAKVAQVRAARVRERQKLMEQSEQLQRKLIIKQSDLQNSPSKAFLEKLSSFGLNKSSYLAGAGLLSPAVCQKPLHDLNFNSGNGLVNYNQGNGPEGSIQGQFGLNVYDQYGLQQNGQYQNFLGGQYSNQFGMMPGSNGQMLSAQQLHNNPSLARIYTRYYITEVIKKGGFNRRRIADTEDECYHGEYIDEQGICLSHDGPFWPSGISPYNGLPDDIAKMDNEVENTLRLILEDADNNIKSNKEPYQMTKEEKMDKLPYYSNPAASFHPGEKDYEYLKSGRYYVYDTDKLDYSNINPSIGNGDSSFMNKPAQVTSTDCLNFDAMFESGNLRSARRVGPRAYELVMNTDRYTHRHTQWFFFSISNIKYKNYKFFLINMHKRDSLYNYGMQPVIFMKGKWQRFGTSIKYCQYLAASLYGGNYSACHNNQLAIERPYYALVLEMGPFQINKIDPKEKIYISHCYPYTYTNLRRHVQAFANLPQIHKILRVETLCRTIAGNNCYILTITDFEEANPDPSNEHYLTPKKRKIALITGRVHPGESQASWMVHGFIKFMLSDHPIAQKLRSVLIFKIVPMINIDGVIVGNYRTSLAAKDLNRNYRFPRQDVFPVIWYIKEILRQNRRAGKVNQFYIDMHGHSRKKSSFMYGCCEVNLKMLPDEDFADYQERRLEHNIQQRMLPWLIGQRAKELFNFDYCAFSMRKSKESTGRIVMYKEFQIKNSFTLEATFAGTSDDVNDEKLKRQFNQYDFMNIGKHTAEALLDYHMTDLDINKKAKLFEDIASHLKFQVAVNNNEELTRSKPHIQDGFIPIIDSDGNINPNRPENNSPTVQRCLKILGPNLTEILDNLDKGFDNGDIAQMGKRNSNPEQPAGCQNSDSLQENGQFSNYKKVAKNSGKNASSKKILSDQSGEDSDSESEPELIINGEDVKKPSKKGNKSKKKKKKGSLQTKDKEPISKGHDNTNSKSNHKTRNSNPNNQSDDLPKNLKESKSADSLDKPNSPENQPFEDPYAKRKGNGQAFFTAERAGKKGSKPKIDEQIDNDEFEKIDANYILRQRANALGSVNNNIGFRVNSVENRQLLNSQADFEKSSVERTKLLEMQNFKFPNLDLNKTGKKTGPGNFNNYNNGWNPYNNNKSLVLIWLSVKKYNFYRSLGIYSFQVINPFKSLSKELNT